MQSPERAMSAVSGKPDAAYEAKARRFLTSRLGKPYYNDEAIAALAGLLAEVAAEKDDALASMGAKATMRAVHIDKLETELNAARTVLENYEAWEADLILNGNWYASGCVVGLRQSQHDTMMELQERRNAVLGRYKHLRAGAEK